MAVRILIMPSVLLALPAAAQDTPSAQPDRAFLAPRVDQLEQGQVQVEAGVDVTFASTDPEVGTIQLAVPDRDETLVQVPDIQLRYGVLDRLELRVRWFGAGILSVDQEAASFATGGTTVTVPAIDSTETDTLPVEISGKARLLDQAGLLPTISLFAGAQIATGSGDAIGFGGASWQYSLAGLAVFGTLQAASTNGANPSFLPSIGVQKDWTERFSTYGEVQGLISSTLQDVATVQAGGLVKLGDRVRLDASVRTVVGNQLDDVAFDLGLSIRF